MHAKVRTFGKANMRTRLRGVHLDVYTYAHNTHAYIYASVHMYIRNTTVQTYLYTYPYTHILVTNPDLKSGRAETQSY